MRVDRCKALLDHAKPVCARLVSEVVLLLQVPEEGRGRGGEGSRGDERGKDVVFRWWTWRRRPSSDCFPRVVCCASPESRHSGVVFKL